MALSKSAIVGGSILGGATLVLGIARLGSGNLGDSDGNAIDLLVAVALNGFVGVVLGGVFGAVRNRGRPKAKPVASHDLPSVELGAIRTEAAESGGSPTGGSLMSFLEQFPPPKAPERPKASRSSSTQGWHRDPLERYQIRYHQGSSGGTGWTNRVRRDKDSQKEDLDDLDQDQILELDRTFPPIEHSLGDDLQSQTGGAGWYADPTGFFRDRYWSGRSWTLDCRTDTGSEIRWASTHPPSDSWQPSDDCADTKPSPAGGDQQVDEVPIASSSLEARVSRAVDLFDRGLISKHQLDRLTSEIFGSA